MPTEASKDGAAPILGPLPAATQAELAKLRAALDAELPPKRLGQNLLVATWNVRAFGDMSETWERGAKDEPKRNMADALAIAEIVSRFDVVAIQESRANLKALRHMLKALGPDWGLILTDVNPPPAGNGEAPRLRLRHPAGAGLGAGGRAGRPRRVAEGRQDRRRGAPPTVRPHPLRGQLQRRRGDLHPHHPARHLRRQRRRADRRAEGDRRVAGGMGEADRGGLPPEPDHPRRLQHRPRRRSQLQSADLDRAAAAGGAENAAADDLRHRNRQALLRPDRLVHGQGRRPADARLQGAGHAGNFNWTEHLLEQMGSVEKSWHISDHYPLWVEFSLAAAA